VACTPNAHTLPVLGTVTTASSTLSSAFAFGVGTIVQADPFQCSTRVRRRFLRPVCHPTAQTLVGDATATPASIVW
jgi:hypothetical protein